MSIQPEIRTIPSFRLIGMSQRQSLVQNTTAALWKRFMPRRGELQSVSDGVLYSLEVYDGLDHFAVFDPAREFTKWAAVEVEEQEAVPDVMSRHRGAKRLRRYGLLGVISLLSPAYLLSVERWPMNQGFYFPLPRRPPTRQGA